MIDCLFGLLTKDGIDTLVLIITAGIIFWYTLETYLIRKESERSKDPIVSIEIQKHNEQDGSYFFKLINTSMHPAFDVTMKDLREKIIYFNLEKKFPQNFSNEVISIMKPQQAEVFIFDPTRIQGLRIQYKNLSGIKIETSYNISVDGEVPSLEIQNYEFLENKRLEH